MKKLAGETERREEREKSAKKNGDADSGSPRLASLPRPPFDAASLSSVSLDGILDRGGTKGQNVHERLMQWRLDKKVVQLQTR